MEAVVGKRKDKSALHLSRYVVDASRNVARSRGDLDEAQKARHVAAVRSHLWPERQDCPDGANGGQYCHPERVEPETGAALSAIGCNQSLQSETRG